MLYRPGIDHAFISAPHRRPANIANQYCTLLHKRKRTLPTVFTFVQYAASMIGLLAMALAVLCMFARGESIIKTNGLHSGIQTRDVLDWRENQSLVQKRQAQIPPRATWGPFLSLGQTKSEYVHLQMTYVAGAPPANMKGDLFLWGGLFDQTNRGNGDLIQVRSIRNGSSEERRTISINRILPDCHRRPSS